MVLRGIERVVENLNKEISKLKKRTSAGLSSAGSLVKARSMGRTPVDTGNLKGSHYSISYTKDEDPGVEVGNIADYAIKVHEDLESRHVTGQAKFLESALNDSKNDIIKIIKKKGKIK